MLTTILLVCLQSPAPETVAEWNSAGIEHLLAREWDKAITGFSNACALAKKNGDSASSRERLSINLSRAYANRGSAHHGAERLPDALADYQIAINTHRDSGSAEGLSARLLVRLGRRTEAFDLCVRLRKDFPRNPDGWLVAAEIMRLRGSPKNAVSLLEEGIERIEKLEPPTLLEHGISTRGVSTNWLKTLAKMKVEAARFANYQHLQSGHFVVFFDATDEHAIAAAPTVANELEAACADLSSRFGVLPAESLTAILSGREEYGADAPAWSAAVFDGRIRLAVGPDPPLEALRHTLRHEYMHALLHDLGAEIPTWFHEGLSQLAENPQAVSSGNLPAVVPEEGLSALGGDWINWTDRQQVAAAYSYSLAFCTWLGEEFGQTLWSQLFPQIRAWGFEAGWHKVFALSPAELDARFREPR